MSTEDKTAAIRREVEERALDVEKRCCSLALKATEGVVIYGVPLGEEEIWELRNTVEASIALDKSFGSGPSGALLAILEMLERGKK